MPLIKRHSTIWVLLARYFNASPKTLTTFQRRLDEEGSPFLTHTLPSLNKTLLLSLEKGKWQRDASFANGKCAYPKFMREFFSKIFHIDGYVRENPLMIGETRQLLTLFYKFEAPFSSDDEKSAIELFIERDASVKTYDFPDLTEVRSNFQSLLCEDPMDIRPRHSNGATADRCTLTSRRKFDTNIPILMDQYPLVPYFFNNTESVLTSGISTPLKDNDPKARLALVPKDSRGPRVISMEPHERMFIQQGLMHRLYDDLENYNFFSKGFINFTDQSINQELAWKSSMDRSLATIDMKDASDLVSWELVKALCTDEWVAVLTATRSSVVSTKLGDVKLKKFASMGSALCFPIEAMLFWSIAKTISPTVWIYGDDIIVPTDHYANVIVALESFGLRVNYQKSYSKGFFRESCGGDFYKGTDVSVVNHRSYNLPRFVSFANNMAIRFGQEIGEKLIKFFEESENKIIFRRPISYRDKPEESVFYTEYCLSSSIFFKRKWNIDLQRYEVRRLKSVAHTLNKKSDASSAPRSEDFYFDELLSIERFNRPILDNFLNVASQDVIVRSPQYYMCPPRSGRVRDSKTHLKFAWVPTKGSVY